MKRTEQGSAFQLLMKRCIPLANCTACRKLVFQAVLHIIEYLMLGYLITAALVIWVLSRAKLWKKIFSVRREIRSAVRRRSFFQYFVAIRIRELLGLTGFVLAAFYVFLSEEVSYSELYPWVRIILFVLYGAIALYIVYLLFDSRRLKRRFDRLVRAYHQHPRRR